MSSLITAKSTFQIGEASKFQSHSGNMEVKGTFDYFFLSKTQSQRTDFKGGFLASLLLPLFNLVVV